MNVVCIGGGPAGLYLGILLKLRDPGHRVVVYERNHPSDTFGFGVVFSFATLGNLETADPVSYAEIARHFARWEDIEIHIRGQVLRSTGHGFCGLERKRLLLILQARAAELGVELRFEHPIDSLEAVGDADVIVAADGVGSGLRDAYATQLEPSVDVRPNKFVWLGTTVPYRAFTFLFKEAEHGLFRVHAYPFSSELSTFIVECRHDTWQRAGLDTADEDATVAYLERVFAEELAGHRLIKNRSIWRNFPTIKCRRWHAGNVVVVGDAVHTAHFSIGSGTKLAMEDSIELAAALAEVSGAGPNAIPAALAAYQERRRPDVEALQAAAQASLEWFETTERVMDLPPVQFAYNLMTRSLRVSHASMTKRDPELVAAVERLLAGDGPRARPHQTPVDFCGHRFARRVLLDGTSGGAGGAGSGARGDGAAGPAGGAALGVLGASGAAPVAIVDEAAPKAGPALDAYVAALPEAAWQGLVAIAARTEAQVAALRAAARGRAEIGLVVVDEPARRAEVLAGLARLGGAAAPAFALVRPAPGAGGAGGEGRVRRAAVPLADSVRNELRLPTIVELDATVRAEDLDAILAAGRADLAVVPASAPMFAPTERTDPARDDA
ncbi:MAG: FAD-dependent monooxygenase [Kofleriaceae bacterium]